MKRIIIIIAVSLLVILNLFLKLLTLNPPKGGIGSAALALIIGLIIFAIVFFWWKKKKKTVRLVLLIASLGFILPETVYCLNFLQSTLYVKNFARSVKIENYSDSLIYWEGITEPLGLKMEIDVSHKKDKGGVVYAPQIKMINEELAPHIIGADFFNQSSNNNRLKEILFQKIYERPAALYFDETGKTHFTFYLYTDEILSTDDKDHICLVKNSLEEHKKTDGDKLTAIWPAVAKHMAIDMSEKLTSVMREKSILKNDPQVWNNMHGIVHFLEKGGFTKCKEEQSHTCYCRN